MFIYVYPFLRTILFASYKQMQKWAARTGITPALALHLPEPPFHWLHRKVLTDTASAATIHFCNKKKTRCTLKFTKCNPNKTYLQQRHRGEKRKQISEDNSTLIPSILNLVKNVADLKLSNGNVTTAKYIGTLPSNNEL